MQVTPDGGETDLQPMFTLSNAIPGTYTATIQQAPDGPVSGTGTQYQPGSSVITFVIPITKFGTYNQLVITGPDGTPIDFSKVTTGFPFEVNAETNKPNDCNPDKLQAPPAATNANASTDSNASSGVAPVDLDHRAIAAFLPQFEHAVQVNDSAFLAAALDPAVIARYGAEQCDQIFAASKPDPTARFTFSAFTAGPEPFPYAGDGMTTLVQNTYNVAVARTADGVNSDGAIHLSVHDGKVGWFTDCTP